LVFSSRIVLIIKGANGPSNATYRRLAPSEREGTLRERVRFLARNSLLIVDEIGCLPIGINSWQSVLPPHQCLLRALCINDQSNSRNFDHRRRNRMSGQRSPVLLPITPSLIRQRKAVTLRAMVPWYE
jgi:hypothetical protein